MTVPDLTFLAEPDAVADWRLLVLLDVATETGVLDALPGRPDELAERLGLDGRGSAFSSTRSARGTWCWPMAKGPTLRVPARPTRSPGPCSTTTPGRCGAGPAGSRIGSPGLPPGRATARHAAPRPVADGLREANEPEPCASDPTRHGPGRRSRRDGRVEPAEMFKIPGPEKI